MKPRFFLPILLVLGLVAAALPAAEKGSKQVSDDTIYDNVMRRLANDYVVKGGALKIDVKDGVVTLRGNVEQEKQKARAEKLTKKVDGVKSVVNELTVITRQPR